MAPPECIRLSNNINTLARIKIGRSAFSSPLLLGGRAAKSGLSCQTCHTNGHANAEFFLSGLSDQPGRADVTSSIFSKSREDGIFNPKSIPSLSDITAHTISRDPSRRDLSEFLHGLIEEEFAGFAPQPLIFESVLQYLRALDDGACGPKFAPMPVRLASDLESLENTIDATKSVLDMGDQTPSAQFLLASAQVQIGRIAERFPFAEQTALRQELIDASTDLRAIRSTLSTNDLIVWKRDWVDTQKRLEAQELQSLYVQARLQKYVLDQNDIQLP